MRARPILPRVAFRSAMSLVATALFALSSCDRSTPSPHGNAGEDTESPSARILPVPLTSPGRKDRTGMGGAGPGSKVRPRKAKVVPLPLGVELPAENAPEGVTSGLRLDAVFEWPDVRATYVLPQTPALNVDGWPRLEVDLVVGDGPGGEAAPGSATSAMAPNAAKGEGRMSLRFGSSPFTLPPGTELRARASTSGFVVVWPDKRSYRVVHPGALRSVLEERRVDRMPSAPGQIARGKEGRRLGIKVDLVDVRAPLGSVRLELAEIPEVGSAGPLLCHFLLALISVVDSPVCQAGRLPLHATFNWAEGRNLVFSVSGFSPRGDLPRGNFVLPPVLAIYKPGELPPWSPALLPRDLASALVPEDPKGSEVRFENRHSVPFFLAIDGVVLAAIEPGATWSQRIAKGQDRYHARDFLGLFEPLSGTLAPGARVVFAQEKKVPGGSTP